MFGKDISKRISEILVRSIRSFFKESLPDISLPEKIDPSLGLTKDKNHGDFTSNAALRLASSAGMPPPELAKSIVSVLRPMIDGSDIRNYVKKVEVKGGFINFWLSDESYRRLLVNVRERGRKFGSSDEGKGVRVNLEFVSANPTGPLTIAHGRQAAIGDTISRILRFCGYDVTNEYYLNDYGRQIDLLGRSVEVRYRKLFGRDDEMPEDGYMGGYIVDIAREIKKKKGDTLLERSPATKRTFRDLAVGYMLKLIKDDLADFGVVFDMWTSQAKLERGKYVERILRKLEEKDFIYEDGGARWFASTRFGDDKDRVVVKSDGSYTYLAPDIAYHNDKYSRGYSRLIDIFGPDHHGYIRRMKAAVQALGHDAGSLDMLIAQLVTLLRGGKVISMSTRKGEFISLREIIDEIGKDVARFFFLVRRLDSHLDFDIELAKKESQDNPVFYIQYAHARICSIKKFSRKKWLPLLLWKPRLELLKTDPEIRLMRKLSEFPFAVRSGAETLEPNRLIVYLSELARSFHSFYTECRVVSDDIALSRARLYLVECVRIVLANGLGLLNITLPEKM